MIEGKSSEVAVHEAAHVLAATEHGIEVLGASLSRREVVLGSPADCLERGQHHGAIAIAYGITALAGHAAAPEPYCRNRTNCFWSTRFS